VTVKKLIWVAALFVFCAETIFAQSSLDQAIQSITTRSQFHHASFGVEIFSTRANRIVYQLNPDHLFIAASTTKLVTEGTVLDLLGADYRFRTRVYRTGQIAPDGTLKGDLVLVGSGDPNLSNRIQKDGILAFEDEDHSYGGPALAGDPLIVLREMVDQIIAHGIKRIDGRVLVDATMFPEGTPEGGTGAIISPIVVNDNWVDVSFTPGTSEKLPALMKVSPETAYVHFVNHVVTGESKAKTSIDTDETENPDGARTVTFHGQIKLGGAVEYSPYAIHEPGKFAEEALTQILKERGVFVESSGSAKKPDFHTLAAAYTADNVVAEHVSPPLSEDVKVTLKVSQNLHASLMPYVLGAMLAHKSEKSDQAGFGLERDVLRKAGLDLGGASQSDGAGAHAMFSPDFMVRYLAYRKKQKDFDAFRKGLPILGQDGTLVSTQKQSPAAGHVLAKTGTLFEDDLLNGHRLYTGKGLAGYITAENGDELIFAAYVNMAAIPDDSDASKKSLGEALGEIASAAYRFGAASSPSTAASYK
jgi:PBP4 family serine-type D-alanyl-D-alanine carboxypeptidase